MLTLNTLLIGVLLGISFCAPIGPVSLETMRRGLRGGFRPALALQLGSLIGDTTFCVLAFLGLAPLVTHAVVRVPLWVAGAVALVYLGVSALRDAWRMRSLPTPDPSPAFPPLPSTPASPPAPTLRADFGTGAVMSLTNPTAILWWVSIGGAMLAAGVTDLSPAGVAAFVFSFFLGCLLYAFFMAGVVGYGRRFMTPTLFRGVTAASGLALLAFGGQIGWQALVALVGLLGLG